MSAGLPYRYDCAIEHTEVAIGTLRCPETEGGLRAGTVLTVPEFHGARDHLAYVTGERRYHLAMERGLLAHSVGVADKLLHLSRFLAPAIPEESCVITGLFHDVGKLGSTGRPLYIPNENEWQVKNRGTCCRVKPQETT